MELELEVKILEIDDEPMKEKLERVWATAYGAKMMRRYVYDFTPVRIGSWIRLRDNGQKATLTIKEIQNDAIDWTKELEIVVDSFDMTHKLLQKLWYQPRAYQENKRDSYMIGDVHVEIDYRPLIPPYIEVEWPSVEKIQSVVEKLWYTMQDTTSINTNKVYMKYWIDLETIENLSF